MILFHYLLLVLLQLCNAFNLDVYAPIYRFGPNDTKFGYDVAEHFNGNVPVLLIGAPRAESGQTGTKRAGALFSCNINTMYTNTPPGSNWCDKIMMEYENELDYMKAPNETKGRSVHSLGKNDQLLASTVVSRGTVNGNALVCAPLIRFHSTAAYPQGSCYELASDLKLQSTYTTCAQKNLPTTDRHNEYGGCMEGFSAAMNNDTIVTGVIGAVKWTGGVFAKKSSTSVFDIDVEKHTMNQQGGVRTKLVAHDYLGYSVGIGRFGFHYENGKPITVVSGATRYGEHGAVVFLPFLQDTSTKLGLTEDKYILNGTAMGSNFGYAVEVVDLNGDGFDDLIVGAPFEHRTGIDGNFGGIVYVYFSQGVQRKEHESKLVFHPPKVLKHPDFYSQFGVAIAKLGNIDGDKHDLNDFAVGAPYAFDYSGAVYIYLGSKNIDKFRKKPSQIIKGSDLPNMPFSMRSFGFSLSGGSDMDGNGYPDLLIGAPSRNLAVLLRSRPVISIDVKHKMQARYVDIDKGSNCPRGSRTCFQLEMVLYVDETSTKGAELVDFSSDVFICNLEAIPYRADTIARGLIQENHSHNHSWSCGSNSHVQKRSYRQNIYLPVDDSKDWVTPLKFRFTVSIKNEKKPSQPAQGQQIVDLKHYPVLNKYGAVYDFEVPFNTLCGEDHTCQTDLELKAMFEGIPLTDEGYKTNVGNKDHIDITFTVENKKEKAYQASFYLEYNTEELELPEIQRNKKLAIETIGKIVHIKLGNPMNMNMKHTFGIRFKITRGRTEGIGSGLKFKAHVNSTSLETDEELKNNKWDAEVFIIKKVELELVGTSDPHLVHFGGLDKAESEIEMEEDIGIMIRHNYTIHNKGSWTVRNVVAKFDWPYQIRSAFGQGMFALYLLDVPTITTYNNDGTKDVRKCDVENAYQYINPSEIALNTKYSNQETVSRVEHRVKRSVEPAPSSGGSSSKKGLSAGLFRVSPYTKTENGIDVKVVTISCPEKTANCFTVECKFDYIDAGSAPVVDFRARLYNATFVEDYPDVEYVELKSFGRLEIDPTQGIEDDPSNNNVSITTLAYPDKPAIGDSRPIPWWIIAIAVIVGLCILLILTLILWKCGFFKRNKVDQPSLYTAQLRHEREQWADTGL